MTVTCSLALLVSLAALLLLSPEVAGASSSSPPPGAASVSRAPVRTKSRGRKARSRDGGAPGRLWSWSPHTAFGWPVRPPTAGLSIPDDGGARWGAPGRMGWLGTVGRVEPPSAPLFWALLAPLFCPLPGLRFWPLFAPLF